MPSPSAESPHAVWQDKEIKFDVAPKVLQLRSGELLIDELQNVEDTKGNNGDGGMLCVTNLRLIWRSKRTKKANLSIGWGSVTSMNVKSSQSRVRGVQDSLYVMTKFNGSRFEFIFTNLERNKAAGNASMSNNSPNKSFLTTQHVQKAYDKSKLFRDLKLRGSLIQNDELKLLKGEEVYNKISGVANLSNQRGNDGVFHLTNVRLVWHAENAENFNVSIPYMQVQSVAVRDSKFGKALVVTTSKRSGGYVLGFKVEDQKKLNDVHKEVEALHRVFTKNPMFGVDVSEVRGSNGELNKQGLLDNDSGQYDIDDDVEIVDSNDTGVDMLRKYYAEQGDENVDIANLEPVFDPTLGLAIEPLPEGTTTQALWNVV